MELILFIGMIVVVFDLVGSYKVCFVIMYFRLFNFIVIKSWYSVYY